MSPKNSCVEEMLHFHSGGTRLMSSSRSLGGVGGHTLPLVFSLVRNGTLLKSRYAPGRELLLVWEAVSHGSVFVYSPRGSALMGCCSFSLGKIVEVISKCSY